MFFMETRTVKKDDGVVETWGVIHFVLGTSPTLCPCYYNVEEGKTDPAAWSEGFCHYNEAKQEAEYLGIFNEVHQCSNCFDSMMIKEGGPVSVNVVVFAEGCVDPEILVTFDEDLAKKFYLEKELSMDNDFDLITWQSVAIKGAGEKQVYKRSWSSMRYSDAVNDSLICEAMIQKVMDIFGVREDAAREYLVNYDMDISTLAKIKRGSDEWYVELRFIIWGDATDEEIERAVCEDPEGRTVAVIDSKTDIIHFGKEVE